MSETKTVLVLASYGLVGPEIIKRLVEKTDVEIIATGRKPHKLPLDSLRVYWALGEVPSVFFLLVRLLAPHRREWAYRLLSRMKELGMKRDYERAVGKGLGTDAVLKLVARGGGQRWEALLRFEDGGIAISYLPVVAAKKFCSGDLTDTGLVTPIDIFEPEEMLEDLAGLGWALEIEESSDMKETAQ